TILSVPLMRDDAMLGVIGIRRLEVQPFSEKQIALVQTFADQAVIAIENVRLFNELQSKNAALTDALNQQTATAEILRSMSSSLTDVQPVFDTIVKSGLRLLDGYSATLTLLKADVLELAAFTSTGDEGDSSITHLFPVALHTMAPAAECVASRRPVVVEDIEQAAGVSEGFRETIRARGWRSALFVPMIRNDVVLGILSVTRRAAGPFAPGETALLETFADQAVIAIENVRLFNETKEALERQTATSEILKVIASSPSEVQPVFDSIVRSAIRLLNGVSGGVCISDGVQAEMVAAALAEGEDRTLRFRSDYPAALDYKAPAVQAIRENRVINVPEIAKGDYAQAVLQRARDHYRSAVAIPMHRGDKAIGSISVTRREPGLFPAHHVELLQTFADQAVIAIENVRLFNETKEALERQTATAEILKVISSSPASVQPVFDAILEQALRLCQASFGYAYTSDGNAFDLTAQRGLEGDLLQTVTAAYSQTRIAAPSTALGRVRSTRRPVHIADAREEEAYKSKDPRRVATVEKAGARTMLAVPLLKNDAVIGAVIIYRREVRLFDAKQIALLQTFADQAVIAIENVRLFNETKEALERQTATAEILRVISSTPTDAQPVFEAIVESALRIFDGSGVYVSLIEGSRLHLVAAGGSHLLEVARRDYPMPITRES
ncbi:MAG TPA: GAF domain-containing protein, partial [Burkholderiales bacterium]|nr:GAF domain-containing protein [Burkholderiales bacterium]